MLTEDFEQGMSLSQSSAISTSAPLDEDILSLESSDPGDSTLLATSQGEQDVATEDENVLMEPSKPACPAYNELLEVIACMMQRLDLPWKREKPQIACGRLEDRFLADHNRPVQASLAFLTDLHAKVERS